MNDLLKDIKIRSWFCFCRLWLPPSITIIIKRYRFDSSVKQVEEYFKPVQNRSRY